VFLRSSPVNLWCVVHAIANHCDTLAALLKALHRRSLVSRKHLRCDLVYTDVFRDRIGYRFGISGDHCDSDSKPMQFLNGLIGFGPNLVLDGEAAEQFPFGEDIENRLAIRGPLSRQLFRLLRILLLCPRSTDAVPR
jgi:hypothetical protein